MKRNCRLLGRSWAPIEAHRLRSANATLEKVATYQTPTDLKLPELHQSGDGIPDDLQNEYGDASANDAGPVPVRLLNACKFGRKGQVEDSVAGDGDAACDVWCHQGDMVNPLWSYPGRLLPLICQSLQVSLCCPIDVSKTDPPHKGRVVLSRWRRRWRRWWRDVSIRIFCCRQLGHPRRSSRRLEWR